ncbi:MAG: alkyl hydroperoxide reductase subunit C [Arsenophonus sp.]|nr:MAG: alkyl hydroperoxide reductase subunit C [Arsenophonus sp.]
MSLINTKVQSFKSHALKKGKFIEVTENNLKGNWSVLFFYPANFTFVCPTELGDLSNFYHEFKKIGVEIYSISTDTHFAHKEWYNHSNTISKIEFTMIGDPNGVLTRNFDVMSKKINKQENYDEESGLAERATFIINPDCIIKSIEINPENVGRNASDLLNKIKAIQHVSNNPGEVCPASWNEEKATLYPSIDLIGKI